MLLSLSVLLQKRLLVLVPVLLTMSSAESRSRTERSWGASHFQEQRQRREASEVLIEDTVQKLSDLREVIGGLGMKIQRVERFSEVDLGAEV
jgi:hypothetical protein